MATLLSKMPSGPPPPSLLLYGPRATPYEVAMQGFRYVRRESERICEMRSVLTGDVGEAADYLAKLPPIPPGPDFDTFRR